MTLDEPNTQWISAEEFMELMISRRHLERTFDWKANVCTVECADTGKTFRVNLADLRNAGAPHIARFRRPR